MSSALALIPSAQRRRICDRSAADIARQPGSAWRALSMACRVSAASIFGSQATGSPVAGSVTAKMAPDAAALQAPPTKAADRSRSRLASRSTRGVSELLISYLTHELFILPFVREICVTVTVRSKGGSLPGFPLAGRLDQGRETAGGARGARVPRHAQVLEDLHAGRRRLGVGEDEDRPPARADELAERVLVTLE